MYPYVEMLHEILLHDHMMEKLKTSPTCTACIARTACTAQGSCLFLHLQLIAPGPSSAYTAQLVLELFHFLLG